MFRLKDDQSLISVIDVRDITKKTSYSGKRKNANFYFLQETHSMFKMFYSGLSDGKTGEISVLTSQSQQGSLNY